MSWQNAPSLNKLTAAQNGGNRGAQLWGVDVRGKLYTIYQKHRAANQQNIGERLEKLGLQIEKIYGVHGRPATPAELQTSIEKRRASELKTEVSGPK